jgi:hypothetical protein
MADSGEVMSLENSPETASSDLHRDLLFSSSLVDRWSVATRAIISPPRRWPSRRVRFPRSPFCSSQEVRAEQAIKRLHVAAHAAYEVILYDDEKFGRQASPWRAPVGGDRCQPVGGRFHCCGDTPRSISQPLIDDVLQGFALLKPAILLQKKAHRLILPVGRVVRAVRRQQNIVQLVQQMSRRQRFVIKHI